MNRQKSPRCYCPSTLMVREDPHALHCRPDVAFLRQAAPRLDFYTLGACWSWRWCNCSFLEDAGVLLQTNRANLLVASCSRMQDLRTRPGSVFARTCVAGVVVSSYSGSSAVVPVLELLISSILSVSVGRRASSPTVATGETLIYFICFSI